MVKISKKAKGENLETQLSKEEIPGIREPVKEIREKREELKPEEIKEIRNQIEKTDLKDKFKTQAAAEVQSIKQLDEEKKIKKLLALAKSKGVIYAVNVAKKMDDPYVLDLLHDILAQEGYYKNFIK